MKKKLLKFVLLMFILCGTVICRSQMRIYSGSIDDYPIRLTSYTYSDGVVQATYAYEKYDTPIKIKGYFRNDTLALFESDIDGKNKAEFQFINVNLQLDDLVGLWISDKGKKYKVQLRKIKEFDPYDESAFDRIELMQTESTNKHYFKLLISKKPEKDVEVIGVRVYEKGTDRLVQEFELYCQFWYLNNISVEDFNFDGHQDFSVFEQSYAGPNTSSVYILRDSTSEKYTISEIEGVSLEFDSELELVYEHNQSLVEYTDATYKVVNNKLVLIEMKCYKSGEDGFIEVECE